MDSPPEQAPPEEPAQAPRLQGPNPHDLPARQVVYPAAMIDVQDVPDGSKQMIVLWGHEVLVFPMTAEYALQLAERLGKPRSGLVVADSMPRTPPPSR